MHYYGGRKTGGNPFLGSSVLLSNRSMDCCEVVEAACGENETAGRAAMLRIAGSLPDCTSYVAHVPPKSSMPTKRYLKVCGAIVNRIRRQLSK